MWKAKIFRKSVSRKTDYPVCNYGSPVTFMGRIWRPGDRLWTALQHCPHFHWNGKCHHLDKFSSLLAEEFVILTTSIVASDKNLVNMTIFPMQCLSSNNFFFPNLLVIDLWIASHFGQSCLSSACTLIHPSGGAFICNGQPRNNCHSKTFNENFFHKGRRYGHIRRANLFFQSLCNHWGILTLTLSSIRSVNILRPS